MNLLRRVLASALNVLAVLVFQLVPTAPCAAQVVPGSPPPSPGPGQGAGRSAQPVDPRPRTLSPYFTRATPAPKPVDKDGFIQRWMLLEPINKPNRSNTVFTGSYVRAAFKEEYFPNQFTVVPKDGDVVKVGEQELHGTRSTPRSST